jgi:hypothetical protein
MFYDDFSSKGVRGRASTAGLFCGYPLVSLKDARELHFVARKTLATGTDPMAERKAESEAKQREVEAQQREAEHSFEKIARKWWAWWSVGKSPRHVDMVSVGPLIDDGAPTTATREPSGKRVFRMGFCIVRSCPRMRATRSIAACNRSLV